MGESRAYDVLVVGGGATGAGVLRDLARRGLRTLLIERGDYGTGTTGRYHGLLHSGGRYVAKDALAARECIAENRILRRIAPASIEDTGGFFVATPDDPDDYVDAFPAACIAADVDCEEIPVHEALRREPALNPGIRRVFKLPDGSVEPWQLIESNIADARAHGSEAMAYQRLMAMERDGDRIVAATIRDERSGSLTRITPRFVVSCAGAWSGQIAAMANVTVTMHPGKGTMLIYNQRMTDTVINRCHKSSDGDIMVPVHTVAILGTTEQRVEDPDQYEITRDEVAALIREGEKLFPDLGKMRLLRAYAGVRPLYQPPAEVTAAALKDGRQISRAHAVLDHGAMDGVDNFVTIVGGKLTTFRRMAEDTVDMVCAKLGVTEPCTTADEILPNQVPGKTYWLGHRLADHEAEGGGDAGLICECELITRPMLDDFLDRHPDSSPDDLRRGTRLGMGPCQGGFCTFRAAGVLGERATRAGQAAIADLSDRSVLGFLRERFKGTRPIAAGRQLQEQWMISGVYEGGLGVESLIEHEASQASAEVSRAER
jgi:glycerol-3-phosphate dehydrogenase